MYLGLTRPIPSAVRQFSQEGVVELLGFDQAFAGLFHFVGAIAFKSRIDLREVQARISKGGAITPRKS